MNNFFKLLRDGSIFLEILAVGETLSKAMPCSLPLAPRKNRLDCIHA